MNRLRVGRAASVVVITAPAGYGKTTLAADWARRDGRAFAWYAVDADADASVFAAHLAAAVHSAQPEAPAVDIGHAPDEVIAGLGRLLAASHARIVLVLDDVSLLKDGDSIRLLGRFVDELPRESQLALVGRDEAPLPLARLRAQGRLLEIGVSDLRFTDREAAALLRTTGTELPTGEVRALNAAVEGWPTGLRLAASPDTGSKPTFEYFRAELLSWLPDAELTFLTRVSVLDRLSAPLCDAVADMTGSAQLLDRLDRSGLFVVPLDRRQGWYRLHAAFRSVLTAELDRREPGLRPTLWRRAAAWCAEAGDSLAALDYACWAGDLDVLRDLVERSLLPFTASGLPDGIHRWLSRLDSEPTLSRRPATAAIGALAWALTGHPVIADRWAAAVERSADRGDEAAAPWQALLRALMCPADVDAMHDDAEHALATLPLGGRWDAPALFAVACADALGGNSARADAVLRTASDSAAAVGASALQSAILGYQSLLATARGDWLQADALATAAESLIRADELDADVTSLFWLAADARVALHHGDWSRVHGDLEAAEALLPRLSDAIATFSVFLRLEFARVRLALGQTDDALGLLAAIDVTFERRPTLGIFREQADELRREITTHVDGPMSRLTAVELRLLPLLATHLSFREIAERLYVSRNTVKTQAISVYRKLGVSSRGDAITHAAHLGLVADEPTTEER